MSSNTFSAELKPDPCLRRIVMLSGGLLGASGVLLILALPLRPVALVAASCGWLALSLRELVGLHRGFVQCCAIRVNTDGELLCLDPAGDWHVGRLLGGSILLRRFGWMRLENGQGRESVEPIRGACRESHDWRRLQVIWRHIGATL